MMRVALRTTLGRPLLVYASPEGEAVPEPHAFLPTQEVARYNRERLRMSDPYTRTKMERLDRDGGPVRRPIDVVTDGNRAVIGDGNHRAQWAKVRGVEQLPVRFHRVTPDEWDLSRDSRSSRIGPGMSQWMEANPGVMKNWYGSPEETYATWGEGHRTAYHDDTPYLNAIWDEDLDDDDEDEPDHFTVRRRVP